MQKGRALASLGVAMVLAGAATMAVRAQPPGSDVARPLAEPERLASPEPPEPLRWLAAAGGATPELNQVSLEQDLALVRRTLAGPGELLYAAGAEAPVVQVLAPRSMQADPVLLALGDLFHPRGGRDTLYRAPAIAVDGPATAETVMGRLRDATSSSGAPLLLVLGGHGYPGETPAETAVGFWAESAVRASELAEALTASERPVVVVATTCFSGGLADLVFAGADVAAGPHPRVHCGVFAAPWDLEASGCDPNPDRAAQHGYALHFFGALGRGEARTVAQAHARVRILSEAPDVPTSTSERWLEAMVPEPELAPPWPWPEEQAVADHWSRALDLEGRPTEARRRLEALETRIETLGTRQQEAQAELEAAYRRAAGDLLARWPVLDDPYHPQFASMLAANRAAIEQHLRTSATYAAYVRWRDEVGALEGQRYDLRAEAAPLERLVRAQRNLARASALAARGDAAWSRFSALLSCERLEPPLPSEREDAQLQNLRRGR